MYNHRLFCLPEQMLIISAGFRSLWDLLLFLAPKSSEPLLLLEENISIRVYTPYLKGQCALPALSLRNMATKTLQGSVTSGDRAVTGDVSCL